MSFVGNRLRMRTTRGVVCRASCRSEVSVGVPKQPGRERHAPAACPSCPDTRVSARIVNGTPCGSRVAARSSRTAPQTVATVASTFVRRGRQAAHTRQGPHKASDQARSREQRDAVCVRTLPGRVSRVRPEPVDLYRARARQGVRAVASGTPAFLRAWVRGSRPTERE
jgi:hypothetical protein